MTTRRSRRWDGTLPSLSADYLKEVLEKLRTYGVSVQFEFPGHAKMPIYQIINKSGRKMGFDGKHLLHSLNENGNISDTLSTEFSAEEVQQALTAPPPKRASRARKSGATGSSAAKSASAVAAEQIEVDKYNYFRANRDQLPAGIQKHADAISALMQKGMSAEQAFNTIIEQHYTT